MADARRSWKYAYSDVFINDGRASEPVRSFLASLTALRYLQLDPIGFYERSPDSRSAFDSRTAAINITPGSSSSYNITEIRNDALWLSEKTGVSEVETLRSVILEWQSKSTSDMLQGFSEAELASLRQAFGGEELDSNFLNAIDQLPLRVFRDDRESNRRNRVFLKLAEERRFMLLFAEKMAECCPADSDIVLSEVSHEDEAMIKYLAAQLSSRDSSKGRKALGRYIKALDMRIEAMQKGTRILDDSRIDAAIELSWLESNLEEMIHIINAAVIEWRSSQAIAGAEVLLQWLVFFSRFSFFGEFTAQSNRMSGLLQSLRTASVLMTLALLDPKRAIMHLLDGELQSTGMTGNQAHYFLDSRQVIDINEVFLTLSSALLPFTSPVIFAWGMVLFTVREAGIFAKEAREKKAFDQGTRDVSPETGRRSSGSSIGSTQQSIYEDIIDQVRNASPDEDPIAYLIGISMDGMQMFDVIISMCEGGSGWSVSVWRSSLLQEIISVALQPLGYTADILQTELAILGANASVPDVVIRSQTVLSTRFIQEPILVAIIFETALARFPYEVMPLLRVCNSLANADMFENGLPWVAERLRSSDKFTQAPSKGFTGFHTVREDENANFVSLDYSLDMYSGKAQKLLEYQEQSSTVNAHNIQPGTIGTVISEDGPIVIAWEHQYSVLKFLGKWLELNQTGDVKIFTSENEQPEQIACEIITLLATLTFKTVATSNPQEQRNENNVLLDHVSNGLEYESDIVVVVFDILEQEIQRIRYRPQSTTSLNLLTSCLKFVNTTALVSPTKVWSYLSRSSLLHNQGQDGMLITIESSIEALSGNYDVLYECVKLFGTLVNNAVEGCVARTVTQATDNDGGYTSLPDRVMETVLLGFTQPFFEIWQQIRGWRFVDPLQIPLVIAKLSGFFNDMLKYGVGVGESPVWMGKLVQPLLPSCSYLSQHFSGAADEKLTATPMLQSEFQHLLDMESFDNSGLAYQISAEINNQVLFGIAMMRALKVQGLSSQALALQMANSLPILVRLLGSPRVAPIVIIDLITQILDRTALENPPSVLGLLGSETSTNLIQMLQNLVSSVIDSDTAEAVWKLLTTLVRPEQQWFALVILTGHSPQQSIREARAGDQSSLKDKDAQRSLLAIALGKLADIENQDSFVATALLRFMIAAQENWPWATISFHAHPRALAKLIDFVGHIRPEEHDVLTRSDYNCLAALVADLILVYMHYARSIHDADQVNKMASVFDWYRTHAVAVDAYNTSLHINLRRNFAMKFPTCTLAQFKQTPVFDVQFGEQYVYNTNIASKALSFEPAWRGLGRDFSSSFLHEMQQVNLNLGLVESQLRLLQSFKNLCTEHATFFAQDEALRRKMGSTVLACLKSNTSPYPEEVLFEDLFQARIDFVNALLQPLATKQPKGAEFDALLATAYDTLRFRHSSYDSAISNNDLIYYRSTMSALLLSLRINMTKQPSKSSDSMHALVLEIAQHVFARGLAAVVATLYDQAKIRRSSVSSSDDSTVSVKDLALLLALLRNLLRYPRLDQITSQLSSIFINEEASNSCLLLYSWSHIILPANADPQPIYAELSLQLLATLSSLPNVAEDAAVNAVLSRITAARVTQVLQSIPYGVGPFNKLEAHRTLYSIWTQGILPVCLSLLHSVARPMAPEISSFLNTFAAMLNRGSAIFASDAESRIKDEGNGAISLAQAQEASMLSLIAHILEECRIAGPSAAVDSSLISPLIGYDEHKKLLIEDIEELLLKGHQKLKIRLTAVGEKELELQKQACPQKEKGETMLEKLVVEELESTLLCLRGGHEQSVD